MDPNNNASSPVTVAVSTPRENMHGACAWRQPALVRIGFGWYRMMLHPCWMCRVRNEPGQQQHDGTLSSGAAHCLGSYHAHDVSGGRMTSLQ
jgi:hypothetical protein